MIRTHGMDMRSKVDASLVTAEYLAEVPSGCCIDCCGKLRAGISGSRSKLVTRHSNCLRSRALNTMPSQRFSKRAFALCHLEPCGAETRLGPNEQRLV